MTIDTLIDKQDNFEIIRDRIAVILANEVANQKALATDAGKDASAWDFDVYAERSNPWEQYADEGAALTPIVNVWFDNSEVDLAASSAVQGQKTTATYNIDIYAAAQSEETSDGHTPGDYKAALGAHRIARLVRNILMAGAYTYLGFPRGELVWSRQVQSISVYQPAADSNTVNQIVGARIVFRVVFTEETPQVSPVTLEQLSVAIKRAEDGKILANVEFDYGD